ncbi:hypothetical protein AJ85_03245 [Alkalihalobacillus alcalophilus ATCC 27647 = CGMCC 1.3604]|uniref:DUF86 domain-containing protein n=2 Tax=Alkalihalobacillus alcalophilus ATCC 27647 = CGMCC 1.3604 TaxID=1218173 RepID=A0A4V3X8U8_ALKAL|nr:hypothetical protein AJ85_03245 [Alkalihalobacillus alcalophilus ATCC 27647 = CGMCC 1.3604]
MVTFMYFVNREKIEKTLQFIEQLMQTSSFSPASIQDNRIQQLALERTAYLYIETIIDVGNSMIDGFIMRDPGSYEDIIEILLDEKVIEDHSAEDLKKLMGLRKQLVQDYLELNHVTLLNQLQDSQKAIAQFPQDVRRYLLEELGPVTAFLPEK